MALVNRDESLVAYLQPRIAQLRRKLHWWVGIRGSGRWLAAVLAILAVDMVLDRLFQMDYSQRLVMLVLMSMAALYGFLRWVVKPQWRSASDEALLFRVEDHYPHLKEALIGGWQLERDARIAEKGWSVDLAAETVRRSRLKAESVNVVDILDRRGHRWNWCLLFASASAFSLLAWGVANHDFFRAWFRRNLLLTSDQWPRQTHLLIEGAERGELILPRGADHRQIVLVAEHSKLKPAQINLEVDGAGGRVWHTMKPTGRWDGREHAFVFHSVASEFRFRAAGGDAVTDWVQVRLVEPPTLVELELTAVLPGYTQFATMVLSGSGPHTVLQGSRLRLRATANKPLSVCQLQLDQTQFDLRPVGDDRREFVGELPDPSAEPLSGVTGGKYTFRLIDDAGLKNLREFGFTIRTRSDQAPSVRAKLVGIAGMVVPRAMLPVAMNITDDYGLADVAFDCHWILPDDSQPPQSRTIAIASFTQQEVLREMKETAVLKLETLPLVPGTTLRLTATATDHQPEPAKGSSREFLLRVVSEEELRADLLRREIEQRRALDLAYNAQMDLVAEVRQLAAEPAEELRPEQREATYQNKLLALFRHQRNIGTSLASIASRFEEFVIEVRNNRLDEGLDEIAVGRNLTTRFGQEIAAPLRMLDEHWVTLAVQNLEQCHRHVGNKVLLNESLSHTAAVQEEILNGIRMVMAAMEDSENYQDLINRLMEFKRIETDIKQQIKRLDNPDRILDKDK